MNAPIAVRSSLACMLLAVAAAAQDWTDEQLVAACPGFQNDALPARLQQIGALLGKREQAFPAICARIHGDHREYRLKIDRLLDELIDPRWQVRENAERVLIEIGGRARTEIQQRKDNFEVLEQGIRCSRILEALRDKGQEQENRELALLRGLVATALYLDADPRLVRALRSALGHTDSSITDGAIRALGRIGSEEDVDAIAQMVTFKNGLHRLTAIAALGRIASPKAAALCRQLLGPQPAATGPVAGVTLTRTEAMAIVRALQQREDNAATTLLAELERHPDPVIAAGARVHVPAATAAVKASFSLPDRSAAEGTFGGLFGESLRADGAFADLPAAELSFADCDTINFPAHTAAVRPGVRVFLNQGSLVSGDVLGIDPEAIRLRSPVFGDLTLPRKEVQGIAYDPALDRLVGASTTHDRLRTKTNEFVDGTLLRGDPSTLVMKTDTGERSVAIADVAGVLLTRPRTTDPDTTTYARIDLVSGERLIGFIADSSPSHLAVTVPLVGAAVLPLERVTHIELGVGGGAMWGFTLIADYSDNKVIEVDDQGRVVFVLEEVFGAWDAECLDNGNLLITEFSVSRVQEVDRQGHQVWVFEDLKNPYDADRLPNGNTLIADTFASRVIEVNHEGQIVWSYAKDIRPFDCDRLPNGNTLIADVLKDRVIEVSPAGEIVWEAKGLPHAHDADRLPNGNTLVTLRNKSSVVEIDREGRVVWELTGLSSPSDADRLPNGNTLVAENTRVREFDRRGNVVWQKEMTWAVEVNRY